MIERARTRSRLKSQTSKVIKDESEDTVRSKFQVQIITIKLLNFNMIDNNLIISIFIINDTDLMLTASSRLGLTKIIQRINNAILVRLLLSD